MTFLRDLAGSEDGANSPTKLTKVVVSMLPFQLNLQISKYNNERLLHQQEGSVSDLLEQHQPLQEEEEEKMEELARRAVEDIDLSALKSRLTGFLNDIFVEYLSQSDEVYSPFSTTVLTLTAYATDYGTRTRRLLPVLGEEMDGEEISIEDLEWDDLEEVDFDSILDASSEEEKEDETMKIEMTMDTTRRTSEVQTVTATFSSVAIFTKDGDLPIPDTNQVAAIQLSAFQENKKLDMLAALRGDNDNSQDPNDLLQYTITASASIYTFDDTSNPSGSENPNNPNTSTNGNTNNQGLDTVILIAVIVASLSLFLLAIGIFIAWRRKVKTQSHYRSHNHHYSTSSSSAKKTTNESIPTTLNNVKKSRRSSARAMHEPDVPPHPVTPSESDFSVSDLGTTTTNADPPMVGQVGSMGEDIVPPTNQSSGVGVVRGAFRNFGKSRNTRNSTTRTANTNRSEADPSTLTPSSAGIYPEAVVSDDISSSLQDYYRSGLASHGNASTTGGSDLAGGSTVTPNGTRRVIPGSDVSVSSMESYGYSLDGYASSVAQSTQYGY